MTSPVTDKTQLRILATSDVHMHLAPFDYFADAPQPGVGLQALSETIDDLRGAAKARERHVLLVDNGDLLQGTALGDHLANLPRRDTPHPLAKVINRLDYTALGIGNHDLDYGLDYLKWFAESLDAPLLSSNLGLDPNPIWLRPHHILKAGPVSIGILSVVPPRTTSTLLQRLGQRGAAPAPLTQSAIETAKALRDKGVDLVLGLAHTGIGPDEMDDALDAIAATGAIDALVGGHTHRVFPGDDHADAPAADMSQGTLHGVPTVMPGYAGALVGCIDLDLAWDAREGWSITRSGALNVPAKTTIRVQSTAFDPIMPQHQATRATLAEEIASTDVPLTSYFAQVAPTRMQAMTAAAQAHAIDRERQGTQWQDLPLLSAVSPPRAGGFGGARNFTDIPAGPLRERHVAELHIYANLIWAVPLTGAEVIDWLERSACAFSAPECLAGDGLLSREVPSFDFDTLFGLNYTFNPTNPARFDSAGRLIDGNHHRVADVSWRGQPVAEDAVFLVAANSFRACGGGNFPGLTPDRPVLRPELSASTVIRTYLLSGAEPEDCTPWAFSSACAGVQTWFETGPGALAYLDDLDHLQIGMPQLQGSGFVRLPITL